ncbi:nucleotidyl transferase AbiEii/AbiGii toxin family protein [Dactylosporangium sp. AC04546]|uniref:nucleotidyl transferase AbiEii/AbiGii toxin family protein n=1 Tax=Dactylosporangium sp. AC04546 TaxID=2862460 RepID=UPI001EDDFF3E|nr:nucleotidyl transferase AbiEii/AbiGii toxin family protein [Dactylosporangium sp. AC04546]WVK80031.1 nucleotidyl transferase AbiEii/AbiGii toxin family protein [Dactylosporangium sp. AC04546]
MTARLAALDHVLALVARSGCADTLVLRGSVTMTAWFGDRAREPGDLDFVGLRRPAPVGPARPDQDLLDLIEEHPAARGVRLHPADAEHGRSYGYYPGGARMVIPFTADDGSDGTVQVDFAYDEALPEPPVATAVPRYGGGTPHALWTASPALSLVWKLQWLAADHAARRVVGGKDLYDAVLLATMDGLVVPPRLRRLVDRSSMASLPAWTVDEHPSVAGSVEAWLSRLSAALRALDLDGA